MEVFSGRKRNSPEILLHIHVRTDLIVRGSGIEEVLADLNGYVADRGGIALADGQILTTPLETDWVLDDNYSLDNAPFAAKLLACGSVGGVFDDDETTSDYDHPLRAWGKAQKDYFGSHWGVAQPFQFGEQANDYGRHWISVRVPGAYLKPNERIVALVDAGRDNRNFYCPCHYAEVVYTTLHRLVCMMCGHMHCVLRDPMPQLGDASFAERAWHEGFDTKGLLTAYDLRVPFVEYQDIFAVRKIWETDDWLGASSEIEFLERGNPDEVARYRASLPTAEDFMEAGWTEMPLSPAPARQMEPGGVQIDIGGNAALALQNAARHFARSCTDAMEIRGAVLDLFQAIELLLKIKLEIESGDPKSRRKTNPSVLQALADCGAPLSDDDLSLVSELRMLRNRLQHDEGSFGYADARQLLVQGFLFLDRFSWDALGWWIADAMEATDWHALLSLPAIESSAARRVQELVVQWRKGDTLNSVETCPHCARETVLRERSHAGFCVYCRRLPVRPNSDNN